MKTTISILAFTAILTACTKKIMNDQLKMKHLLCNQARAEALVKIQTINIE